MMGLSAPKGSKPQEGAVDTYNRTLIFIHWATALLIVSVFASIELRGLFEKGSIPREFLKSSHFMLGLSVLALTLVRIFMALRTPRPAIDPAPPAWQANAGQLMHIAIYAIMIVMPILGWLTLSAAGKPITFSGLTLPPLIAESKDTAEWLKELHHEIGEVFYWVIGLHAAAALFHHYVIGDNTLRRILPSSAMR
jgi:superoxide oxidase